MKLRTSELERTVATQTAITDRLRATFETSLIYQGFLNTEGILLDSNKTSLAALHAKLHDVLGRPFWETPWFSATPGMAEMVRESVAIAAQGQAEHRRIELNLPIGRRVLDFSLRPAWDDRGTVIGIVPEAVDLTNR